MTAQLLIYAKPPRIGVSKTRLAAGLGRAEARRIAALCLSRTLRAALDPRWTTTVYTPRAFLSARHWGAGAHLRLADQGSGGLGARLAKGLTEAPHGPVIFIGADAPGISKALIWRAVRKLGHGFDIVTGPARDGGFWLLGLAHDWRDPALFDRVRWSSAHTLRDLLGNVPAKARISRLPILDDIDTAEDWHHWCKADRV